MTIARALATVAATVGIMSASAAGAQSSRPTEVFRLIQGPSTERDSCRRITAARVHDALSARRWNDAVALWENALAVDGDDADHWQGYGDALFHAERYRESIAAFERAMLLGGAERDGAWNVARAYARLDKPKQALRWLGTALERGERDAQSAREEPAFGRLRGDPRFRDLTQPGDAARGSPPRARLRPITIAAG